LLVTAVVLGGPTCSSSGGPRDGGSGSGGDIDALGSGGAGGLSGPGDATAVERDADASEGTGGVSGTGGNAHLGGAFGTGGSVRTGGASGTGGSAGTGGAPGMGGNVSTAGALGTGGIGLGGAPGTGGSAGTDGGGALPLPPGLTWTRQRADVLCEGIWGSSANDVYAVGRSGSLVHSTGDGTWTTQPTGTASHLTGIWGSSATDIYVSVLANVILHSTGDGTWVHYGYTAGATFDDVWGSGPSDIYVVGPGVVHGTGNGAWQRPPQAVGDGSTFAVWGTSATNIYVATGVDSAMTRTIHHSTGDGVWRAETTPVGAHMQTIWGADASHIFAGGGNMILFSTGDGVWTAQLTIADTTEVVVAIWGAGADAVYACTQHGYFYRSNGAGQWSEGEPIQTPSGKSCFSMWGTAIDNIYLGTIDGIYHGTL